MNIIQTITAELSATAAQITAAVELLDDGATVPFIARYRKEATGGLDDTQPLIKSSYDQTAQNPATCSSKAATTATPSPRRIILNHPRCHELSPPHHHPLPA